MFPVTRRGTVESVERRLTFDENDATKYVFDGYDVTFRSGKEARLPASFEPYNISEYIREGDDVLVAGVWGWRRLRVSAYYNYTSGIAAFSDTVSGNPHRIWHLALPVIGLGLIIFGAYWGADIFTSWYAWYVGDWFPYWHVNEEGLVIAVIAIGSMWTGLYMLAALRGNAWADRIVRDAQKGDAANPQRGEAEVSQ